MATSEELDSRCSIEIVGALLADREPAMLADVLARMTRHMHAAQLITIYCSERKPDGWLEWQVQIQYRAGGRLILGVIQRTQGAEVEFHS